MRRREKRKKKEISIKNDKNENTIMKNKKLLSVNAVSIR